MGNPEEMSRGLHLERKKERKKEGKKGRQSRSDCINKVKI